MASGCLLVMLRILMTWTSMSLVEGSFRDLKCFLLAGHVWSAPGGFLIVGRAAPRVIFPPGACPLGYVAGLVWFKNDNDAGAW